MTDEFLRYLLPCYFLLYFFILVVFKSITVRKQIGKSPIVLTNDDSAHGLIGFYVKCTLGVMAVYIIIFSVFPQWYKYFMPFKFLENEPVKIIAILVALMSLAWIVVAQNNMHQSWRIGIDLQNKTELITNGVYKISRNPIYVGMLVTIAALFFMTPNVLTLLILAVGFVLIQIQIRLEEEYLTKMHGQDFLNYKQKARRWL